MLVIALLINILHHAVSEEFKDLRIYPMEYYCGQSLRIDDVYQFLVEFETIINVTLPNYSCYLTFTEPQDLELRMAVRVVDYEVHAACQQRLELHDFSSRHDYVICSSFVEFNTTQKNYIYSTWTNRLRLKYVYGTNPQGSFKIVVTLFHEGQCASDEVKCSNGFCIKKTLYCNGHKPCGNVSADCDGKINSESNSIPIVIGAVVPVVILIIVGVVLYGYCFRNTGCRNSEWFETHSPRFLFIICTARRTRGCDDITSRGPNFEDPPDYNSLNHQSTASTVEPPPAYEDVIKNTAKYKVVDNNHEMIIYV